MVGGDFLGLLLREDILDENVARWYIAEMILCIEEAHRMNWIHRDVKPDNFLIASSGHLKISDFGLAFDGHWTHNQTYYNDQRYTLLQDLDLQVQGDAQDCQEEREKQGHHHAFDVINGRRMREKLETKHGGVNGPVLDWLNRTQRREFAKSVVSSLSVIASRTLPDCSLLRLEPASTWRPKSSEARTTTADVTSGALASSSTNASMAALPSSARTARQPSNES